MGWEKEWKNSPEFIKKIDSEYDNKIEIFDEEVCSNLKPITFKDGHKSRSIDVIIIGDLGLDFDDDGWNIYHIPTLACFSSAVPGYIPTTPRQDNFVNEVSWEYDSDQLLTWMKKVQENYPTAWGMLRCLTPENYSGKGQSAKDIIQKWCLSVSVI